MSIATKTGDDGTTGLMYNRRVSKCYARVEAYGTIDELNAALGLARAAAQAPYLRDQVLVIQKDLIVVMGEMSTLPEDLVRFLKDGFSIVTPELTAKLDRIIQDIEAQNVSFKDWATPGQNPVSAALDFARTVCRRAERCVSALRESHQVDNQEIIIYLNRLSDALWLMARWAEGAAPLPPPAS